MIFHFRNFQLNYPVDRSTILIGISENENNAITFLQNWTDTTLPTTITTSGTTGKSKQITISRTQIMASAKATIDFLALNINDRALCCLNTKYIAGKMMLARAIIAGMDTFVVEPSANPFTFFEYDHHITFAAFVPLQMQEMLKNLKTILRLNQMKAIIIGGAPISLELHQQIQLLTCPVYHTYGMTETVSHIALKRLNGIEQTNYFQLLPHIQIQVDDRKCLMIYGSVTNNEWITTNDVVEIIESDKFIWLGRYDNIINSGGIKINPETLEQEWQKVFVDLKIYQRFYTVGQPSEKWGQEICLIIEGTPLSIEQEQILIANIKQSSQPFHYPKQIKYLPKFEESNHKIIRKNIE